VTEAFTGGAALLLAVLLAVAGVLKLAHRRAFAHAVHRLLPSHLPRRREVANAAGPIVGGVEIAVAAALCTTPHLAVPAAAVTAGLFAGFCAVVVGAIRKGTSCGCFTSLSDGAAGATELTRTAALGIIAVGLLGADLAGDAATPRSWQALAGAAVLAVLVLLATLAAQRGRSSSAGLAWMLLGRVRSRLGSADLPRQVELRGAERAAVLEAVASVPSVRAFVAWLGDGANRFELDRALIRTATAEVPGGSRVNCLLLTPPHRAGLTVSLSVPWDGHDVQDAVVIAQVDGQSVFAMSGTVREAIAPVSA
jgi:hypothetical protein